MCLNFSETGYTQYPEELTLCSDDIAKSLKETSGISAQLKIASEATNCIAQFLPDLLGLWWKLLENIPNELLFTRSGWLELQFCYRSVWVGFLTASVV
jgi:hypothetical protein